VKKSIETMLVMLVFQKRSPRLRRRLGVRTGHQIGNCSFGNFDFQLEQFAVNSGCTPERIGLCHPDNKIADSRNDRRSPRAFAPGLKSPEQFESFFMPSHHDVRFDNNQRFSPVPPESRKQDPEKTIPVAKSGPFGSPLHGGYLLPKRKVLQSELGRLFESQKYAQDQFH
jgi:hypothetical protein